MSKAEKNPNIKKPKRAFHKTRKVTGISVRFFLEIFIICIMLFLFAGGVLVYKLSKKDLDVEFARQHLEETINAEIAPYHIQTGKLDINWNNIFERPVFEISDFVFLNPNDETLLTLEDLSFTFSRSQILVGKFLPREVTARGLDLHFVKREDGAVQLGFVAGPSFILYEPSDEKPGEVFSSLDQIYEAKLAPLFRDGFLSGLKTLKVKNSAIVYEDLLKNYALSFPDIDASLRPSSANLSLDVDLQVQNGQDRDLLQLSAIYDIKFKELQTSLATENFNPFLWASLFDLEGINAKNSSVKINSDIHATFDNRFNFQGAEINSETMAGHLDLPGLYDHPFEFKMLALNGFFNRQALTFDLKDSVLDAYGVRMHIDGSVPVFLEDVKEYNIPLAFRIDEFNVPIPEIAFPDKFEDKPIYEWLTQKLETGTIKNLDMGVDLTLSKTAEGEWKGDLKKLLGGLDFENVTAIYKNTMVPLSNASGRMDIDSGPDEMVITSDSGNFENIDLADIKIRLTDVLAKKKSTVDVSFNAKGGLKDILAYLAREPINIDKNIQFNRHAVEGTGDLLVNIVASTRKNVPLEEMKIGVEGKFYNLMIPKLVRELDISANEIDFSIQDMLMSGSGQGRIAGREGRFNWQQYMKSEGKPFKMKVEANLMSDVNLRQHFGVEIDDFVTGNVGLDLVYVSQSDKSAEIDIAADLTPAQLRFETLGYIKPSGGAGRASLKANLSDNRLLGVRGLNISASELSIKNASLDFQGGKLKTGRFPQNTVGQTNVSLNMDFESEKSVSLDIKGAKFDARPVLADKEKKEYTGPAIKSYMEVNELLTHENERVTNAKVFFRRMTDGNISQFEMDGLSGNGEVYIRYKPGPNGSPNLTAEFSDAGSALRAFGLYQNVRGGRLTISGTSSDQVWKGNVTGVFLLQNFSVRNAPVLAKLINAMSLPGLSQLLGNDGVVFSKLRADFQWTSRPEGSLITVRDGRTSGSELGLTFEGIIDRATNSINMEGTIVPVSSLNKLIGDIPLLGPVITGGTGSLIAATYKIKGPFQNAEVRINPLSALAPGIIRKILFED